MFDRPIVYAVKHQNEATRMASRSGGIFTALSDSVLKKNGVVYGCVLNENFQAVHVRAEDREGRNAMRGSKYVQSRMDNCLKEVKKDLEEGLEVLFSGTSCQVAGLLAFLGKPYEKLYTVDIVCHGVPSPLVWQRYLKWFEEKEKMPVTGVDFRNKAKYGWEDHVETLTFGKAGETKAGETKSGETKSVDSTIFTTMFVDHNILRPACFECPYKSVMHPADVTIADYWGIDDAAPGFNDHKGVSLVLVNNEKGSAMFEAAKKEVDFKETRLEDSMQPPLIAPFKKPLTRDKYWQDYKTKDFGYMVRVYGGRGIKIRTRIWLVKQKRKIKDMLRRGKK